MFRTTSRTTVGTTSLRTSFETTSQPEDEESLSEEVEAPDGFGDPLTYDRSQRGQHSQPRPTLSPIGTPIMSSGRAVEEQAGRPRVLGHAPGAGANGLLEAIAPGLKSDSKTDQSATAALMLSVVGWVFCFPFSLVALYLVKKTKDHALVEGRDLPQIATVATVLALLNLGFTLLTCAANVQIN
ncbi:MAG: hypothetical protein JKY65_14390 [Planctomycetes bacterium]|nr:hypothetical protein [Planctomycetota bacterium]